MEKRYYNYLLRILVMLLIITSGDVLYAQNLVPNPSFEDHTGCPVSLGNASIVNYPTYPTTAAGFRYVQWWINPNYRTSSDWYHRCATIAPLTVGVPVNQQGNCQPRTGDAYAGIIPYGIHPSYPGLPYSEHIQCKLTQPLKAGAKYCFTMYARHAGLKWANTTTDSFGVYISDTQVLNTVSGNFSRIYFQVPYSIVNTKPMTDTTQWLPIQGIYTAHGGEEWLTIGRFCNAIPGPPVHLYNFVNPSSPVPADPKIYFYIDDVSLEEIPANGIITTVHNVKFCTANSVLLDPNIPSGTHIWNTGDTTATVTATAGGTYWCMTERNCILNIDTFHVKRDTAVIIHNEAVCSPATITLVSSANVHKYLWSTGDTTHSLLLSGNSGKYYCTAIDTSVCKYTLDTFNVTFFSKLVVDLKDTNICESNMPLVLRSPQPAGVAYLWSNGLSDSTMSVTHSGKYWLQVKKDDCMGSDTVNIKVIDEPEVNVGQDTIICAQTPVKIGTEIPKAAYLWNTGETTPYIYADNTADYVLKVTVDGCRLYDTVHITAMPAPVVDLGDVRSICLDEVIPLNATTPQGARYQWNTGATTAVYNATKAGLYTVRITSEYGCVFIDSILLEYIARPTVMLPNDTVICEEAPIVLTPTYIANETSLLWSTGNTERLISIIQGGAYSLYATNECGTTGDTINVRSISCDVWWPDAFTPNNDGKNDYFHPVVSGGMVSINSFFIYNRWGEQVFNGSGTEGLKGWDGNYKGVPAEIGAYFYIAQLSLQNGAPVVYKGNVTLVR